MARADTPGIRDYNLPYLPDYHERMMAEMERRRKEMQERAEKEEEKSAQSTGGMGSLPLSSLAKLFTSGGSGAASGAGGAASGGAGASAGGAASGAGGAAGGASGAGSTMASAGPWAALAAAIYANESSALDGGYRDEDRSEYNKDLAVGAVVPQDINKRWGPKVFGEDSWKEDRYGLGSDVMALTELGSGDIGSFTDELSEGSLAKLIEKIF